MQTRIHSLITTTLAGCLLIGLTAMASAASPAGKWTWSGGGGRAGGTGTATPRVTTLELKVEGGKLTGTITTPGRGTNPGQSTAIENGKITENEISFAVTREGRNGTKTTTKYSGTVTADTITGKTETERGGTPQSRKWEAKKAK